MRPITKKHVQPELVWDALPILSREGVDVLAIDRMGA